MTKTDTIAGLALKYGVTLSDIKRANGLVSEWDFFVKDVLVIPKQQLPIDEHAKQIFASIMSGYGRDPCLNFYESTHPGSRAAALLRAVTGNSYVSDSEDSKCLLVTPSATGRF